MTIDGRKTIEIQRLNTPLTIKDSRAYDRHGNLLNCTETLSDVRFIIEPKENILTDDEILQYAHDSKAASEIRLKRGIGEISDVLLINESLPWIFAFYYVILACIAIPIVYSGNKFNMFIILVLALIPLIYSYKVFNLNNYMENKPDKPKVSIKEKIKPKTTNMEQAKTEVEQPIVEDVGLESLKKYKTEVHNLKVLFDLKEEIVKDLIEKRFEPPQITYDKFISMIDTSHKLFYNQHDSALNIIKFAAEDTPRVESEIQNKIDSMHKIINLLEDLTNELVININDDGESTEEVKNLLEEMENLIGSVKEY
ncbi:hypothetical protein [Methanobrevibacter sp.]|uniref:hypothetical protein n=1 Tax=Methanobrevibacter sp. TaxID=66852 RepID=UPI00388EA09E